MAEKSSVILEALSKVQDNLQCAVCLENYTKPKVLQCFHFFCEHCLQKLAVHTQQGHLAITCPTCRHSTSLIPPVGVSELQTAFHVHHLEEIQQALYKVQDPQTIKCEKCKKHVRKATSFCRTCGVFICSVCTDAHEDWVEFQDHEVVSIEKLTGDVTNLVPLKKVPVYCPRHKGKELELYCETCGELICHNCTVKLHSGHEYCVIGDEFEQHKAEIEASLIPLTKHLVTVDETLRGFVSLGKTIDTQRSAVKISVESYFKCLFDSLEARKAELMTQLDRLTEDKLKKLSMQREKVTVLRSRLSRCEEFVSEGIRTGSQGELMKMKQGILKQIKDLTESLKEENFESKEVANTSFSFSTEFYNLCKQFGEVYFQQVDPEKCYVEQANDLKTAEACTEYVAIVRVVDQKGLKCDLTDTILTGSLAHMSTTTANNANDTSTVVAKIGDGRYKLTYKPVSEGQHQLTVQVNGADIQGSPFSIKVFPEGCLHCPVCVCPYDNPKLLPCSHTFCEACLDRIVTTKDLQSGHFSCPVCRSRVKIPPTGVSGFPTLDL